jgi:hypothetical protein
VLRIPDVFPDFFPSRGPKRHRIRNTADARYLDVVAELVHERVREGGAEGGVSNMHGDDVTQLVIRVPGHSGRTGA